MWVGVTHAGYTVRDELPILLIVFAVPAVIAAIAVWQLSRG
jgi:cytochrome oxidase assembly protein ShyY1